MGMILAAVASYTAARWWQERDAGVGRRTPVVECDLRLGPCRRPLDEGAVTLAITPSDIPLMRPLILDVKVEGADVSSVLVEIRGLNMDMGLNRVRLQTAGDGAWRGETILPICSRRRMEWEASVRLDNGAGIEIPYRFITLRR
ncbi:MAG: hypothetical protein KDJ39_02975 [Gammaproteobacteria bacterium]|nr:hypothetical protein [Gammaproteobacteria bacterium]